MTKLSVAIIARDRQKEIEACLKSVRGADEIIVLDTGSVDKTPTVAIANGAKVFYYRWEDDFSAARNRCLDYVQNPWVLSIDTDEVLVGGIQTVYDFINRNFSSKVVGVRIDQPNGAFYGARLFRKEQAHWQREIHEELSRLPDMVTDEVVILHRPSKDHNYNPTRNIEILRRVLERNPVSQMDVYYLGEELFGLGEYDAAIYWLRYYTELAPVSPNLTSEAYYLIAECYCKLHRVKPAIESLMQGIAVNPEMKALYTRMYQLTKNDEWATLEHAASNRNVLKIR
jgi:glycosyltransferase involved in cell wall biosynthesis